MWERCFPRSPHIFTFNDYIYGALSISTKVNGVFLLMADFTVSLKYQSHLNINPLTYKQVCVPFVTSLFVTSLCVPFKSIDASACFKACTCVSLWHSLRVCTHVGDFKAKLLTYCN